MKRLWAVLLIATALAGCRSSQPATNPFLRTTVPPPATGQAAVVTPGEPFTPGVVPQPAPPPVVPVTPPPVVAPPMIAPPKDKFSPPGGSFQYNQSSNDRSLPAAQTTLVKLAAYTPAANTQPASAQPPAAASTLGAGAPQPMASSTASPGTPGSQIRILPPRTGEISGQAIAARGAAPTPSASPLLHVVADDGSSQSTSGPQTLRNAASDSDPIGQTQVAIVTPKTLSQATEGDDGQDENTEDSEPAEDESDTTADDSAGYAFAPDYGWLRGRLEYSQSLRQWKLRYIPIDGQTDQYGGSVKLSSFEALKTFQPGDMVAVRGAVAAAASTSGSFAPLYELAHIESAVR